MKLPFARKRPPSEAGSSFSNAEKTARPSSGPRDRHSSSVTQLPRSKNRLAADYYWRGSPEHLAKR
ncbi:hypothetical protein [Rhizobium leguminosarum]|uniref:hypothetical protein n=1 Tax=Rhizobium leguminosarum TaxID=384 RepID=UPI000DE2F350|nr:hypothetical protein [Rhizobium leguminosarum]TCA08588.1 hypothetical protein E0H63_07230 [Rhizobium leguminosarum bv. viciae]